MEPSESSSANQGVLPGGENSPSPPLRLLVLSDLHLEGGGPFEAPADADFDALVLAGDIHSPGVQAIEWALSAPWIRGRPVIFVGGNHELYGCTDVNGELNRMSRAASGSHVHMLHRRSVVLDGVRFLGCTLWTDFQLAVDDRGGRRTNIERAMAAANELMNDFQQIRILVPAVIGSQRRQIPRLLLAEDTMSMHWVERDWLRRELNEPFAGPTVVVTHHAPAVGSLAAKHRGDRLSPAFVSDLPDELFEVPRLWIHGHTHHSVDYVRRNCRVLSNPRGYVRRDGASENLAFDPGLIVEVSKEWPPGAHRSEQILSRMRARVAEMVLQGTQWLSDAELLKARPGCDPGAAGLIEPWLYARRIFAIENEGILRVPAYALDQAGEPVDALMPIMEALQGLSADQMAAFFESPSGYLSGRRPREALHDDGNGVLYAAQRLREGAVHG